MAGIQNFRKSFRGFNRKDVVDYIEYMNNTHNAQIEQLSNRRNAAVPSRSWRLTAERKRLSVRPTSVLVMYTRRPTRFWLRLLPRQKLPLPISVLLPIRSPSS